MERNEWDWAVEDIEKLFIQNGMKGSMIYGFFHQCLGDKTMSSFYIDDRVPFRGKRKLYQLVKVLEEHGL